MKFSCDRNSLSKMVNKVIKGVTPRTTLPILQGILIKCANNEITMYCTDTEIGIKSRLNTNILEEGSIVISSKVFSDVVRKLPDDIVYLSTIDNNLVNIKCGSSNFTISGNDSSEFPEIPDIKEDISFKIKQDILKDMIRKTSFCVAQDMARPILTGVLFEIGKNIINMVALDGYRMSIVKYLSDDTILRGIDDDLKIVVPGSTLDELTRVMNDDDEEITISFTNNQVMFNMSDTNVISKLLDGNYMNYNAVLPRDFKLIVVANKQNISDAIDRASLLASSKNNLIKFTFNDNELIISSNSERGKMYEKLSVKTEGNLMEIAFNSKYLLDALKVIDVDNIKMSLVNSINPMIISPDTNENNYLYMVLPVKLNG